MIRQFPAILILALVCPSLAHSPAPAKGPCENQTLYARVAIEDGHGPIKSPDGKKSVAALRVEDPSDPEGQYMSLLVRIGQKRFKARLNGFRSEILWAPDSSSFAVNETEGGGGFDQRAYIFYVKESGLTKLDVSRPVEKAFGFQGKCDARLLPNTAVLAWLAPDRLLAVAEVVDVSVCKHPGTFLTYEVSFPDLKILARHTQRESKQKFMQYLGCELRGADDKSASAWQNRYEK
ncbi:MAG TPA: hypothetical protein VF532_06180 [Candidatus Angelobacter sp.]